MGQSNRTTEGILLLFATLVLLLGFTLTFLAKLPELNVSASVNINTADSEKLASALMIDRRLAKRICEYRQSQGAFSNTASLHSVKLLTRDQVDSLAKIPDIARLTPSQISARSELGSAMTERLVEALALGDGRVTAKSLARIPVVNDAILERIDSRLRVRDAGQVTATYWAFATLLIIGFFLLHVIVRRRSMHADPFLLPCMLILSGLGGIILFSMKDPLRDTNVFPNQMQGVLLGVLASMIPLTAKFRSFNLRRYTYIYALLAVFLTIMLTLFGSGPGGVKLRLFSFHPIEVVKIALVFFVASYLADRWEIIRDKSGPKKAIQMPLFRDIGPLIVMYMLSLVTFVLVRDLGPMLIMFGMFVVMLYVATGKPSFVGVGAAIIGVTGWLAYMLHLGVFDVRVDMWLHPWNNSHPNGMQLGQALWGFGTGGIWGSGLGLGRPDLMSRAGSDLVFASLGEELGLIGSLFILMMEV